MGIPDQLLLRQWTEKRNAEAFSELVARHADMVYGTCRRVLGNPRDAEDVAQECFLRLVEAAPSIRSSVGGWLHALATHRALDRVRSDARREERERRFAAQRQPTPIEATWEDLQEHVDEAIAELPNPFREALVAHFLELQTHEAIAVTLGISRQAVSQRIAKGIEKVRRSLQRRGLPVSSSALTALVAQHASEAVPKALTSSLGRLAIAGVKGMAPSGASAGAALASSSLAVAGGIMVKKVVVTLAVIAVGLGLAYSGVSIFTRERTSSQATSPKGIVAGGQSSVGETPQPGASVRAGEILDAHGGSHERSQERPSEKSVAAAFAILRKALSSHAGPGQSMAGDAPKPYSSADIPANNGAHYFLLAAELFLEIDAEQLYAKWDEMRANGWVDDPEIRAMIEACQPSIEAVRMGLAVGNAMMPLAESPEQPLPYLATFRQLARVMALEAQTCAASGDYTAAFEDYSTLLDFANESSRGGCVIHTLVGYAMNGIAMDPLQDAVAWGAASPDAYRLLIERLGALDECMVTAPEGIRAELETMNQWLSREVAAGTDLRQFILESSPDDSLREVVAGMADEDVQSLFRSAMGDYARVADFLALPFYETADADAQALAGDNPVSEMTLPPLVRTRAVEAAVRARNRGTMVEAAVELYQVEHNAYPASLADLAPAYLPSVPEDPFSGRSFVYAPTESGYLLYSAGADMQDDGGMTNDWQTPGADMVFHRD